MIEKIIVNSRTTEIHGTTRLLINAFQQSGLTRDLTLSQLFTAINDKKYAPWRCHRPLESTKYTCRQG